MAEKPFFAEQMVECARDGSNSALEITWLKRKRVVVTSEGLQIGPQRVAFANVLEIAVRGNVLSLTLREEGGSRVERSFRYDTFLPGTGAKRLAEVGQWIGSRLCCFEHGKVGKTMSPKLSPEIQKRVDTMYPAEKSEEVSRLLAEECGRNIFGSQIDESGLAAFERLCFAALKVSNGDVDLLKKAIDVAKEDYRDLIGAAGFAWSTTAHKNWLPRGMGPQPEGWWTRRRKKFILSQD